MMQRLTYRKRRSYATKSNQHRVVKTPGDKLVYQTTEKRASGPKCSVTGKRIQGIPHLRPAEYEIAATPESSNRESFLRRCLVRKCCSGKDHPGLPGGRAENRDEGIEDPEGKGKARGKELRGWLFPCEN